MYKEELTNEKLNKRFTSQFDLVNYSIKLAENMIRSGRGERVRTGTKNRALQIIAEIEAGQDVFDDIIEFTSETGFKENFEEPPKRSQDSFFRGDKKRAKAFAHGEDFGSEE